MRLLCMLLRKRVTGQVGQLLKMIYRHRRMTMKIRRPLEGMAITINLKEIVQHIESKQPPVQTSVRYLTKLNSVSLPKNRGRHDTLRVQEGHAPLAATATIIISHTFQLDGFHDINRITMKSTIALLSFAVVAAAIPDPQITPRAQLEKRQADPALLGYVSKSGDKSCKSSSPTTLPLHIQSPSQTLWVSAQTFL